MRLFESARIRLTVWYLAIIGLICVSFSAIIYRDVSWELEEGFRLAELRLRSQSFPSRPARIILEDQLAAAKSDVLFRLLTLDGVILLVTGVGGYILAGATLSPIKQTMEDQKRFIADASHELKTPITALLTEIEVSLRDKSINLKTAKELLKSNLDEVTKMKDMTNHLLSLSSYEKPVVKNSFESVDIPEAINMAVQKNKPMAGVKKIKIISNIKPEITYGDPASLVDLFSIIINNAIKYSPQKSTIRISSISTRRHVKVFIKDQGIGISNQDIPHIFERFYRGDKSRTKNKIDGYGLGLSIAKAIVDSHSGEIKVINENPGTTFEISLPKA